jgi:hypothetical protein
VSLADLIASLEADQQPGRPLRRLHPGVPQPGGDR